MNRASVVLLASFVIDSTSAFDLGAPTEMWGSGESPATGIQVNISTPLIPGSRTIPPLTEVITLTTVIPTDFTE